MPRRHRKHGGEHEGNNERWLLTYSDMITLLMAFFIMMYSMSVLNLQKFNEVAISIRSGFGGILTGKGKHLLSEPAGMHVPHIHSSGEQKAMADLRQKLTSYITSHKISDKVEIRQEARGVVISMITDDLLFDNGKAELNPHAHELLYEISRDLGELPNDILVEGHTCSLPIATAAFPSNWELSTARASRVVRFLQNTNIAGYRLSAIGYAETRPREPNDSEGHRKINRRVDIVILSSATTPDTSLSHNKPSVKPEFSVIRLNIPKALKH